MKRVQLAVAVGAVAACLLFFTYKQPPTFEQAKAAMWGRWIFNSDYCEARLPASGLIELRLEPEGLRTGNNIAPGQWSPGGDSESLRNAFGTALTKAGSSNCLQALPSSNFAVVTFQSMEQAYAFAYSPGSELMMVYINDKVLFGAKYDEAAIRNLSDPAL